MRTTLDIDRTLLEEALAVSEKATKKAVIEESLREYIRTRRIKRLREMLGTFELDLTLEELLKLRAME